MKIIRDFNDFTIPLLEKSGIGRYQKNVKDLYKKSGVELHNSSIYSTSLNVLIQLVESLMKNGTFYSEHTIENAALLTIFAVSILTNESKDKTQKLYDYLISKDIIEGDMDKVINQLKNTKEIFSIILKKNEEDIINFEDMLKYTSILVPYISILNTILDSELLNPDMFSVPFEEFKDLLTDMGFQLLLRRILRKLNIMTQNNHKFQNKDNAKPLKVNDEFKSPMFKSVDTILEEKLNQKKI